MVRVAIAIRAPTGGQSDCADDGREATAAAIGGWWLGVAGG